MNKTLREICRLLDERGQLKSPLLRSQAPVQNLSYNSKTVSEGTLFFCKGAHFKPAYLEQAQALGAVAYVSEQDYELDLPLIQVEDIRLAMPIIADFFYQAPYQAFHLTGITGTKGKTTTTFYLTKILDLYQESLGKGPTAYLSSSHYYDGVDQGESHLTTPESLELFYRFNHVRQSAIDFMTMEVSSQALKYHRVAEVPFEVGAFLNISTDHISPSEHPNFEDYFMSKLKLFDQSRLAVINLDADHIDRIYQRASNSKTVKEIVTVSTKDEKADYLAKNIVSGADQQHFVLHAPDFEGEIRMKMLGRFNVENALVAIVIARYYQVPYDIIKKALQEAQTEGRMEVYHSTDKRIHAIVDFAHNKLSLEKLFEASQQMYPKAHSIVVFGSAGDKAISRRKDLGEVAAQYADEIILTMDDPGTESVGKICQEINRPIQAAKRQAEIIPNRPQAIAYAFQQASAYDGEVVVLIAGKGDEDTMKINGVDQAYPTDRYYVKQALEEISKQ